MSCQFLISTFFFAQERTSFICSKPSLNHRVSFSDFHSDLEINTALLLVLVFKFCLLYKHLKLKIKLFEILWYVLLCYILARKINPLHGMIHNKRKGMLTSSLCYMGIALSRHCIRNKTFCEVSWNSKSWRYWKFQLSILTNKKVLFLMQCLVHCNSHVTWTLMYATSCM